MVNVGGRSKGCSTCRRRRVKCDETRPVCNRCQRCGYGCDGPKDATFIVGKIVRSRRRVTGSLQRHTGRDERAEHRITLSPPLTGNEFELYLCYSRTRLRPGAAIDLVMQKSQVGDLVTAGTTASSGHVFPRTLLSFATIVYGAQHRQAAITNKGYALHGSALKQLNRALSDSSCHTQDEVLLSVATLAILECLVPTGSKNYLNHMLGLEKLLALRDPSAYSSPLSLILYKSVRHMILFASLHTGRPSILAKPEWKKVLRASCLEHEMQEQDLFDILADCTVLVAGRDKVLANRQLDAKAFSRLRDRIEQAALSLQTQLCTWRQRWGTHENNAYSEIFAAEQESDDGTSPLPLTFFEFENEPASIMLMFYNTTLIYVLRILASLQLRTPKSCSNQPLTQVPSADQEARDGVWKSTKAEYVAAECSAALDVCRCVPYYSACTRKHTAPIVHWSVTTARGTLASNESTEARSMMAYLGTKCREVVATGLWTG